MTIGDRVTVTYPATKATQLAVILLDGHASDHAVFDVRFVRPRRCVCCRDNLHRKSRVPRDWCTPTTRLDAPSLGQEET
jgi:hypothetical protein